MASTSKTQPSQQKGEQPRKKCDYCGRWGHNFVEYRKHIDAQRREGYKPVAAVQADSGTNINHGNLHLSMLTSDLEVLINQVIVEQDLLDHYQQFVEFQGLVVQHVLDLGECDE
ncbi:hypothetical protein ACH5RR_029296 [Cinchona calisaya]|uniref:CCHC-type domain-containing protein n=1 Tax=Cinchona calisaya TaxID=153742 RepID=A0ABD2YUS9_9GENT